MSNRSSSRKKAMLVLETTKRLIARQHRLESSDPRASDEIDFLRTKYGHVSHGIQKWACCPLFSEDFRLL
jgi:hypothetical protein